MKSVIVRELFANIPTDVIPGVTVKGWVRTSRESKNFAFIVMNDGSCFNNLQIVVEESAINNYAEVMKQITVGASIEVTGRIEPTPGMQQPFEMKAESVTVLGVSPVDYPLQKKRHTLEYLRTIQHLRPRANLFQCAFRIRSIAAQAIHRFFHDRGFVYVHTPLITGSDCEGAGEMFQVTTLDMENLPKTEDGKVNYNEDFFGKPVSLTVSGQLNAEIFALAFRDIYTFGPTFRAENSYTARHAAEFWMIEPEIAFAELEDDLRLEEDMIKYIISAVLEEAPEEMKFLNSFVDKGLIERLEGVKNAEFARVSYTDSIKILEESGAAFEYKPYWGCDLQTEHERYLTEKHFGRPVFVTDYPKEIKAFYMRMNDDGK
ncbi:MAG: asparagine--tRNA ligase, partial [Clostridia bacterium]|nr:asparagine--tRNA ligase [Clostridia bacterium]